MPEKDRPLPDVGSIRTSTGKPAGIEKDVGSGIRDRRVASVGLTRAAESARALEFKPTTCSNVIERSASTPPASWILAVTELTVIWGTRAVCAAAGCAAHRAIGSRSTEIR